MTRIRTFQNNILLDEAVLQVEPFKITVSDLMTTLPPRTLSEKETKRIKDSIPTFRDGWLTDKGSGLNVAYLSCFKNVYGALRSTISNWN